MVRAYVPLKYLPKPERRHTLLCGSKNECIPLLLCSLLMLLLMEGSQVPAQLGSRAGVGCPQEFCGGGRPVLVADR